MLSRVSSTHCALAAHALTTAALSAGVAYMNRLGYGIISKVGTGLILYRTSSQVLKALRSFEGNESAELLTQKVRSLANNFLFGITTLSIYCLGKALSISSFAIQQIVKSVLLAYAGYHLVGLSRSQLKNYSEINRTLEGFFCFGRFVAVASFVQHEMLQGKFTPLYLIASVLQILDARPPQNRHAAPAA